MISDLDPSVVRPLMTSLTRSIALVTNCAVKSPRSQFFFCQARILAFNPREKSIQSEKFIHRGLQQKVLRRPLDLQAVENEGHRQIHVWRVADRTILKPTCFSSPYLPSSYGNSYNLLKYFTYKYEYLCLATETGRTLESIGGDALLFAPSCFLT